jgi:hypothetical protein
MKSTAQTKGLSRGRTNRIFELPEFEAGSHPFGQSGYASLEPRAEVHGRHRRVCKIALRGATTWHGRHGRFCARCRVLRGYTACAKSRRPSSRAATFSHAILRTLPRPLGLSRQVQVSISRPLFSAKADAPTPPGTPPWHHRGPQATPPTQGNPTTRRHGVHAGSCLSHSAPSTRGGAKGYPLSRGVRGVGTSTTGVQFAGRAPWPGRPRGSITRPPRARRAY